jgi:hypothetical protein
MTVEGIEKAGSVTVTYFDPLTTFLYNLMMQDVPVGTVAGLVDFVIATADKETSFANGYLAQYAHELSEKIQNAKVINLKTSLTMALDHSTEMKKVSADELTKKFSQSNGNLEEFTDEEVSELETIIKGLAMVEPVSEAEIFDAIDVDGAKNIIDGIVAAGNMTDVEAEKIKIELDSVKNEQAGETTAGSCKKDETCAECKCVVEKADEIIS